MPSGTRNPYVARKDVLQSLLLVILSPCLLGLPAVPAHSTGQSVISKASRTAAVPCLRAGAFIVLFYEILMTKLYVGNLPFTATEEAVRNLFAPHGTVEKLSLISDRDTGQPRGFAFVEMSSADASRAMQALNGKDFDGRPLKINEAQDKPRSGGGGGGRPRY
jgi:RNA recognition motif. (a.k.a. RRM, RBD, or RNP domain)